MTTSRRRALVTGADGFIGSHVTEALVDDGWDVRALVLYNSFNSWGWLDNSRCADDRRLEVVAGDVRDGAAVMELVHGCDVVLHLAALISIPHSYVAPESFVDTNVKGTLNVLLAARQHGIRRLIHTSTSEVYGSALTVPISEDHPLQGQSPYSATKIGADHLALSFHKAFGTPVTVIRPFNCYGPRQSARAIIPTVITQIASGQRQLRLGSLHPRRDFSFVADTVSAFKAAIDADGCEGEVINVGSGFDVSIGETVEAIASLMDADIDIEADPARVRPAGSEVERLLADNRKAAKLLGWTPTYAGPEGLSRGLLATIEWFSAPENLRRYKARRYNT